MAARKPDSEVGTLGVWAYDTARDLDLSAAQVAARVGVTEPTIRKIEGGSNRQPSVRLIRAMHRYFQERAHEKGTVAPPPPDGWLEQKPSLLADQADLAAAIREQTEAIKSQTRLLAAVLHALSARSPEPPDDPQVQEALAAWAEAEQRLSQDPVETSSPPRKPSRGRPRAVRGSASRTGDRV